MNMIQLHYVMHTISPIHVGCDQVYEPTDFVVDKKSQRLVVFDPLSFIGSLDETRRHNLMRICRKGTPESILDLYRFFNTCDAYGRGVPVSQGFIDQFEKVLKVDTRQARKSLNNLQIRRTAHRAGDQRPYIPGSSIKGALRTAYLNQLAKDHPDLSKLVFDPKGNPLNDGHKKMQSALLSLDKMSGGERIQKDPFRMVKVSDFMPVGEVKTRILYAVNIKKRGGLDAGKGPPIIVEVVEPGVEFVGSISVHVPPADDAVSVAISVDALIKSIQSFYGSRLEEDRRQSAAIGSDWHPNLDNGSLVLKVGFHSGAEAVTVDRYRKIWIMGGKGKKGKWGNSSTTLWFTSASPSPKFAKYLKPFGWMALSKIDDDTKLELDRREQEYIDIIKDPRADVFSQSNETVKKIPEEPKAEHPEPTTETWENILLTRDPGSGTISAVYEGKKAETKDKTVIAESVPQTLFTKKKNKARATKITVEKKGGNYYVIIAAE